MANLSGDRVRAIESLVTEWMREEEVPGVSLVLVDEDGERYAEGVGARDLETNAPATPDTLYGVGSISKSVTALAVAQLADAGGLSLDDAVDDYVDHFAETSGEPITIAGLLSHTSGMPAAEAGVLDQALEGRPAGIADADDYERHLRDAGEWRVTGEDRFMYFNAGYDVLGRVIENVDGRRYATYVREEVLEPLGMERSTFHPEPFEDDDDAMTGYLDGEDTPEPTPFPFEELIHPSGGLVSSVRELGRFLRAAMADGELEGSRVASPGTFERLQRRRVRWQTYLDGREEEYGYGWIAQPLVGDRVVGHGGSIGVSTAYAGYLEDERLGVAIACNASAMPHPGDVGMAVLALATGHDRTAVPAFALEEKCEAVTGTYESFGGRTTATVERAEGGVSLSISGGWMGDELVAYPTSLSADDYAFEAVGILGEVIPVEFDVGGDRVDLFFQRHRFRRAAPGA